jgi:hypothetical protein
MRCFSGLPHSKSAERRVTCVSRAAVRHGVHDWANAYSVNDLRAKLRVGTRVRYRTLATFATIGYRNEA